MSTHNYGVIAKAIRPIPDPPPIETVTLTMPYDVAKTLLGLTNNVGGEPTTTYRSHTNAIGRALLGAGVETKAWERFESECNSQARPIK